MKISKINQSFRAYKENAVKNNGGRKDTEIVPFYSLSKNKKNIVVLFLDRAIGIFPKSIFSEFPEMKEQFRGFSYYPNTVSFSNFTVEGTPPMLGGYEYTQENINARSSEYLREKHNEASLVMPKLFYDAGFEVTVTDPPWGNYRWAGDLSAFEKIPEIKSKELSGKYYSHFLKEKKILEFKDSDEICRKEIINFIFIESIFPFLRKTFNEHFRVSVHVKGIPSKANSFFSQLSNLFCLPLLTDFDSEKDTFTFVGNDATHEVAWKLNDDYETPAAENSDDSTFLHYQANVAAFKQIGKWLNFLRENNCYDNTRLVIVSDHGRGIDVPPYDANIVSYNALLMVKDFNSNGDFKIDESFMTNADTLFLAKKDLCLSDENPFTHKKLIQQKENGINVYDCAEINAEKIRDEKKFKLDESKAWHVSENIFDNERWIPLNKWKSY